MSNKVKIKEVFSSIQGEGPFIGYKQVFVRFCGCNLNCNYCDTNFELEGAVEYSVQDLVETVKSFDKCHSISLTGGEPLLQIEFLKEFLPLLNKNVYLETNATLGENLAKVIDYIDYISADIKLPSCSGNSELWKKHYDFFEIASNKNLFAKVVFDNKITDEEIERCCDLAKSFNIELVLQPKMDGEVLKLSSDFLESVLDKFLQKYSRTRLIPQVHKFLNVR